MDAEIEALPLPESMQDLIKAQINIFAFPQCEVSQHILDLFALVEETVREAGDSPSSHSAVRLFGTGLGPLQSHFFVFVSFFAMRAMNDPTIRTDMN